MTTDAPTDLPLKAGGKRKVRWRRAVGKGRADGSTTYAVGIDVTDEDEILRRVLRSERLAAVGTLAAGLAHEVRNPLNSAALQLTLLERRLDRGDEPGTVLPIAHIIKSEIDRLDRLVREFLAFAQPRPLEPRPVDVVDLFAAVDRADRAGSGGGRRRDRRRRGRGPPPSLGDGGAAASGAAEPDAQRDRGDERQGRPATPRGAGAPGAEVEIDVEDDGPGFGEELPVFDAFFTTKTHGTGLGLAIVHRIVADHGGTIRVESRPGRTCFTLALPAAP